MQLSIVKLQFSRLEITERFFLLELEADGYNNNSRGALAENNPTVCKVRHPSASEICRINKISKMSMVKKLRFRACSEGSMCF